VRFIPSKYKDAKENQTQNKNQATQIIQVQVGTSQEGGVGGHR
jgi:hypothetical protein